MFYSYLKLNILVRLALSNSHHVEVLTCESCGGRIRTYDLQVMSLASYQLLHSAMFLAVHTRLELVTSCGTGRHSNHLN